MRRIFSKLKTTAPWIVALLIFYYLFKEYPLEKVIEAAKYVNPSYFIAFALFYFLTMFIMDCAILKAVIARFDKPVKLKDILIGRAATYLIMVVNYPASQAGFAYYLKKRYGIAFFEAFSLLIFVIFVDLMWLVTLAFLGSLFQTYNVRGVDLGHIVNVVTGSAYVFLFLWVGFWRHWYDFLLRSGTLRKWVDWIRNKPSFRVFKRAKLKDYAIVGVMRAPIHVLIITSMYVVIHTFGVGIPFAKILGNIPLVFFIGTLPITPGGLGTTNVAMVELLAPSVHGPLIDSGAVSPRELIFAASIMWLFANYFMKAVLGTIFFGRVSKDLLTKNKVPEAEAQIETQTDV